MRLKQLSPEKIREYANYLDGYRDVLPFMTIINGSTTLEKTVEDFYDIEDKSYVGRGPVETYEVRVEDTSKKGKTPQDLLEFLSRFDGGSFDIENLTYERVRRDIEHFNRCRTKASISLPLGMIVGIIGLPVLANASGLNSSYGFVGGITISAFTLWYNFFGMDRGDRPGKVAFVNLKEYGASIDKFIQDYRMLKEKQLL